MEEPRERRAVAGMGPARAFQFDGVLAGARQGRGIGPAHHGRPAASSAAKYQADDKAGSISTDWPPSEARASGKASGRSSKT